MRGFWEFGDMGDVGFYAAGLVAGMGVMLFGVKRWVLRSRKEGAM